MFGFVILGLFLHLMVFFRFSRLEVGLKIITTAAVEKIIIAYRKLKLVYIYRTKLVAMSFPYKRRRRPVRFVVIRFRRSMRRRRRLAYGNSTLRKIR